MKDNILKAIKTGTEIIADDYEYNAEYKNKVNQAIQLLLKSLALIDD